jgi:hypothetical protein
MREDQIDQAERRETLENDRKLREAEHQRLLREGTTFHQFAQSTANDEAGGRFAAIAPTTVTGATPVPRYPAAGAHQCDPVGIEPPLGFSVNDLEPIEPSALVSSAEATGAPAGAVAAAERLPSASAQPDDAGASLSHQDDGNA